MRRVYKYEVTGDLVRVKHKAKFLHFGCQNGTWQSWFEIDTDEYGDDLVMLKVVGTGHDIPDGMTHLASTIDGNFVWHLYKGNDQWIT